jgi:hypothetical protein
MSRGDAGGAASGLRMAGALISQALAAAPAPMMADLSADLDAIKELQLEVTSGDLARAAKRASADTTLKSRRRGSRRPASDWAAPRRAGSASQHPFYPRRWICGTSADVPQHRNDAVTPRFTVYGR